MKKTDKKPLRLSLGQVETIRVLQADELGQVAGGGKSGHRTCPETSSACTIGA